MSGHSCSAAEQLWLVCLHPLASCENPELFSGLIGTRQLPPECDVRQLTAMCLCRKARGPSAQYMDPNASWDIPDMACCYVIALAAAGIAEVHLRSRVSSVCCSHVILGCSAAFQLDVCVAFRMGHSPF